MKKTFRYLQLVFRRSLIGCVSFYQNTLNIFLKKSCVFYPSCSEYAKLSIQKHGSLKGFLLACRRILRCHPWQKNHIDPV